MCLTGIRGWRPRGIGGNAGPLVPHRPVTPLRGSGAVGGSARSGPEHLADPVAGTITRDNVSVDVSAAAYYRMVDAVKSVAIENVRAAIGQIAQTTLRKVVGQHTPDQTLAETDTISLDIRKLLDATTADWAWR
jgi:regulator of protease activity HflC (stomatin/prohibitin superfamily)